MANSRAEAVAALEQRIGHDFRDKALLERALTHASVGEGAPPGAHGPRDNERLEFLGDSIVNMLVAQALYQRWPKADEGALTRALAAYRAEMDEDFPQDPVRQLTEVLRSMARAWDAPTARLLRQAKGAPADAALGLVVQDMALALGPGFTLSVLPITVA